jgi:hypothetical protein
MKYTIILILFYKNASHEASNDEEDDSYVGIDDEA